MSRKVSISVLLLFLALLILPSTAVYGQKISIVITGTREVWMKQMISDYKKINPGVVIDLNVLAVTASDNQAKITMMMQSPQTSPDIINEDAFKINADSAAGYLEAIDDRIAAWPEWSQFIDAAKNGVTAVDGKVYAIPDTIDVLGLWYSKTLFRKAGLPVPFVPKTWKEVSDAAEKIQALNLPDVIPYFIYTAKTFPERASMRLFQPLYNGTGNSLYNYGTKKWTLNRKAALDVFNYVDYIVNVKKMGPPLDLGVQNQVETIIQQDLMKNHKVGIWLSGNWMATNWKTGGRFEWKTVTDEVGFAKIPTQYGQSPGFTSMSGGWSWAIPRNAKNKDAAWEFMKFMTNKENYTTFAVLNGELTARKDVGMDPRYKDPSRIFIPEATDIINYTKFRPSLDIYPQISILLTESLESIGTGKTRPADALKALEAGLLRVIGKDHLIID